MQYDQLLTYSMWATKLTHHLSDTQWQPFTKQSHKTLAKYMYNMLVYKQTNNQFLIIACLFKNLIIERVSVGVGVCVCSSVRVWL